MLNTMIVITTPVLFIMLLFSPTAGHQQHDDDYVDPTDLFNFDPVNVRMMKTSKTSKKVGVDTNVFPKDSHDTCEQTGTCAVPNPKESDVERSEFINKQNKNMQNGAVEECSKMKSSLESSMALSRQYVNKLVHILEPKVGTASSSVEINLRLKLSYHDIVKLRKFGQGNSNEIHDVYETLSYMVQFASDSLQPESPIYWLEMKTGLSSEVLLHILVIVICILSILIVLSKMTVSRRMLGQLLFVTFAVSVIFNWIELYQKQRADQEKILMMEKLSDRCPKMDELSFFWKIATYVSSTFTFQNENCREYFQAMLVSPLVKASPIEAVSVAFVKTIVTPLGIIGTGIKAFFVGLLKDLPGQYQMFIIIILFVLVILLLFFSCGYYLRIFGLISLGPSESRHSIQGPPHNNQYHLENTVNRHTQGSVYLQQRSSHDQVMGLEAHQRTNYVLSLAQSNGDTAIVGTERRHLDVSGQIEQVYRQRPLNNISDNVNRTDCEDTLTASRLSMHTTTEASRREQKVTDSRQCKQESGDGNGLEGAVISSVAREIKVTNRQQQCKHESGDCNGLEAAVISSVTREEKVTNSRQQCKQESGDGNGLEAAVISSVTREEKVTNSRQQCKQESGDGNGLEAAVISSVTREEKVTNSRQQCKQESGDGNGLEAAAVNTSSVPHTSLREEKVIDTSQQCKQESVNKGDKDLTVTAVSISSVAHVNLTEQNLTTSRTDENVKSGKDTAQVANELTDLTCTNSTSQACESEAVMTERNESMNISRNS